MSLDTVLKIGKILRKGAKDKMKHFRYVASPKPDNDGNYPICITIPVKTNFSFDWNNIKLTPQKEMDNLYYLVYKTSDNDTSAAKYVFGDIYYQIDRSFDQKGKIKDGKESGNYIIKKSNAYENAKKTRESYIKKILGKRPSMTLKEIIQYIEGDKADDSKAEEFVSNNDLLSFWHSFFKNKDKIEQYLTYAPIFETPNTHNSLMDDYCRYLLEHQYDKIKKVIVNKKSFDELTENDKSILLQYAKHSIYLHFEFENGKNWYEIENCFDVIIKTLNEELTDKQQGNLLVPISFIYPTLCSGNAKNDIQFPGFYFNNSYKSFAFKEDNFQDFLYTSAIIDDRKGLNKQKMWLKGTNISIYVFPAAYAGQEIKAENYESFFFENRGQQSLFDFDFLKDEQQELFTRFDFVFSDTGGNTNKTLIEISGIERSKLLAIRNKIEERQNKIAEEKKEETGWDKIEMSLETSFTHLLGKFKENNKGEEVNLFFTNEKCPFYQSHMLKVLPLIYMDNYYSDDILLSKLIEKVEYSVRLGVEYGNFMLLKYDLKLIYSIQNYINNENDINKKYNMEITESKSYQLGVKLGKLSKPLDKAIASFKKNYVGLLTRRIATKDDCISFANDICEKLVMHEKMWNTLASEVCSDLAALPISEYDKEKLAFGYFEGYFKYEPNDSRKSFVGRLEKVLSDYYGKKPLENELEQLNDLVEQFNKQ